MLNFVTKAPLARRTLFFGSATHVWSDLFFALLVPLLPLIKEDMGLSFTEVGLLKSLFSGASAVLQIPAGFLAEVGSEFWLLILGNVWVAAGLVGMALSPVFAVLLVASFIGGLGGGTQHPLASSMVSRAYDAKGRSTAVGTVNFAGDIGKMIAPLVALIAIPFGWRATLWVVGIGGIIFMTLSILARRSVDIGRPKLEARATADDEQESSKMGGFVTLSAVGFLDSATRTAALVFLPFVMDSKGMGTGQISVMLILLFAGGAVGKFVVGWLGDRMSVISLVWWTKGLTAALLAVSLLAPPLAMAPLLFVTGIGLNGTSSILYATVAEFVPASRRGRFYGFFYTTNEGGTVLAPLAYGLIADFFSLSTTMVVMGIATSSILPASLALRKYLAPKETQAQGA
ncbi:MAG: MFS transporter [Chloroflexi bacterium]|nr:MFS transporter [Chloroflexota bacterium]